MTPKCSERVEYQVPLEPHLFPEPLIDQINATLAKQGIVEKFIPAAIGMEEATSWFFGPPDAIETMSNYGVLQRGGYEESHEQLLSEIYKLFDAK